MDIMTENCFAGVDVSKGKLDTCLTPGRQRHSCSLDKIEGLIAWLKKRAPRVVAMEATGGYEREAAAALAAEGFAVAIVNPGQVRAFAKASGRLAKTDKLDAETIADFVAAMRLSRVRCLHKKRRRFKPLSSGADSSSPCAERK